MQNKYKKVYDENYKEYKSKLEEFYSRYPDAQELFKRYTCMLYCSYVCMFVVLCCIVRKAHRLKGMYVYICVMSCTYFIIQLVHNCLNKYHVINM